MSTIIHESQTPSFLAPAPAFSFFDQPEIYAPAPEAYEQWRLAELVPIHDGWFYHQPTHMLAQAETEAEALSLVDWQREIDNAWHERTKELAKFMWWQKRPWWLNL